MEFSQMSSIQSFIPKHSINTKILNRSKTLLLSKLIKHSSTHSCCMCTHYILTRFLFWPCTTPTTRILYTMLMSLFHTFQVSLFFYICFFRVRNKESVMSVSSRMLLWLEQRIKVPEWRLNKVISRHLCKSHFQKYLSKLLSNFKKRMKVTSSYIRT
jgi:hypothetical protein